MEPNPILVFSQDNTNFGLNPSGMVDRKLLTWSATRHVDNKREIIYESLMFLHGSPMDVTKPMTLTWNNVYGALQYVVIVSKGSSLQPPKIFKEISETSYTFTEEEYLLYKQWFDDGNTVYFSVAAVNKDYIGISEFMHYSIIFGQVNAQAITLGGNPLNYY